MSRKAIAIALLVMSHLALPLCARQRLPQPVTAGDGEGDVLAVARAFDTLINAQAAVGADGVATLGAGCSGFTSTLTCSATRTDRIDSGDCFLSGSNTYAEFHRMNVVAGQQVTFTVTSTSSFTFLLAIQDINTGQIRTSKFGKTSVALTYTPPATESIIVTVGIVESFGTGSYSLQVQCGSGGGTTCSVVTIGPGTTIGSLGAGDCLWPNTTDDYRDVYRIAVRKGETVRVVMTSEFPAYLDMYESAHPHEGVYAQNAKTITTHLTATEDGFIEFVASSADGSRGGYSLNVTLENLPGCRQRSVRH